MLAVYTMHISVEKKNQCLPQIVLLSYPTTGFSLSEKQNLVSEHRRTLVFSESKFSFKILHTKYSKENIIL